MRIKVKAIIAIMLIAMTGCASNTNETSKETDKLGIIVSWDGANGSKN